MNGGPITAPVYRVTHGRHCACSACRQEDWTRITSPCGMHGEGCPAVYDPITPDVCHVYVVASKELPFDKPTGNCFVCGAPLADHAKQVSSLVPEGQAFVIDEQVFRV